MPIGQVDAYVLPSRLLPLFVIAPAHCPAFRVLLHAKFILCAGGDVPNSTWTIEVPLQVVPIPEYPRSFPSSHLDLGTCLDDCMNESRHTKARFTNCGCFKLPVRSGCFESTCAHALYSYHVHICWQMEVDVELASLLRDELGVGTMGGAGSGGEG